MEMSIRSIPNSNKYIAVAAPHHGENYGSVIHIDTRIADDRAMSQVKRLTPDVLLPEAVRIQAGSGKETALAEIDRPVDEEVEDHRAAGGGEQLVAEVTDNHQGRNTVAFEQPLTTRRLSIQRLPRR